MKRGDEIKLQSRRPCRLRSRCKAFQIVLREAGYDDAKLSSLTGCAPATLRYQRAMGFPSRRTRARIEAALGTAIWSEPEDFAKRQRQKQLLGFDPVFVTRPQLRALAKATGLALWSDEPNKRRLIARLCDHIEGHPHLQRLSSQTSNSTPHHD